MSKASLPSLPPSLTYLLLHRVEVFEELGHDLFPLVLVIHQVDDGVRDLEKERGRGERVWVVGWCQRSRERKRERRESVGGWVVSEI